MKSLSLLFLFILGACLLVPFTSAFTVTPKNVPTGDLRSNEQVTIVLEVRFASFSTNHNLEIFSNLKDQNLSVERYDPVVDVYHKLTVEQQSATNWLIMGWILPTDSSFSLRMTMSGVVPTVTTTQNITLLMLSETSAGITVSGGEYKLERRVVNPAEISTQITNVRSELAQLKNNISVTAAEGANVTEAQKKYAEAETALNRADSLKTTNFGEAQTQLENARAAISAGQSLLEKAIVLYEMGKVDTTMGQVSEMITYFKVNRSISTTDSRIVAITNKYDLASQSLSSANDLIGTGAYMAARSKVQQASGFADEAMNLSVALREEIGEGGFSIGINPLFIVAGIVIIIIAIGGYFAYKKFFRWDELG